MSLQKPDTTATDIVDTDLTISKHLVTADFDELQMVTASQGE